MEPNNNQLHVHDHIASLRAEAAAERLARQARDARAMDAATPESGHPVRTAVCRALIGLGETIAATAAADDPCAEAGATARDVVAMLSGQAAEGVEHLIVNLPDAHELARLDAFGREVIPAVAEIEAA